MPGSSSPWFAVGAPLTAATVAFLLWLSVPAAELLGLVQEGGAIERATHWLYFLLAAWTVLRRDPRDDPRTVLALGVMFAAFGAREMDLHKAWTGGSMLKVSFYLDAAPWTQKAVSLLIVAAVAAAAIHLIRRHAVAMPRRALQREPMALSVAVFVVTMVVSKVFDRSINLLAEDFAIVTPLVVHALVAAQEEILELSLPVIAGIALWQHGRTRRSGPAVA